MLEVAWALLLLAVLGGVTAAALVPWNELLELGQTVMWLGGAIGIPVELVYFALLGLALQRTGLRPAGWYWASFMHHHLLAPGARWLVLPWFYVGALAFAVIVFGMLLIMIAVLSALRTG